MRVVDAPARYVGATSHPGFSLGYSCVAFRAQLRGRCLGWGFRFDPHDMLGQLLSRVSILGILA